MIKPKSVSIDKLKFFTILVYIGSIECCSKYISNNYFLTNNQTNISNIMKKCKLANYYGMNETTLDAFFDYFSDVYFLRMNIHTFIM